MFWMEWMLSAYVHATCIRSSRHAKQTLLTTDTWNETGIAISTRMQALQSKNNFNSGTPRAKGRGDRDNTWPSRGPFTRHRKAMQTNVTSDLHSPRWRRRLVYESGPTGWAPPPAQKNLKQDCYGSNHLALTNSGTGTESRICYPNTKTGGFSALYA